MDLELNVRGKRIMVADVPETTWKELRSFWPRIAKATLEVFIDGGFQPYEVTKLRPDGCYAGPYYWTASFRRPNVYPLREARRFLIALKRNDDFVSALNCWRESMTYGSRTECEQQ